MPVSQAISSPRLSPGNLNELIALLGIQVLGLSECVVSQGFMLELDGDDAPGIHYILSGEGRLDIAGAETVPLKPHTLQIAPPGHSMKLEVPPNQAGVAPTIVPGREHKQVVDSKQLAPTRAVTDFCVCYQIFTEVDFPVVETEVA